MVLSEETEAATSLISKFLAMMSLPTSCCCDFKRSSNCTYRKQKSLLSVTYLRTNIHVCTLLCFVLIFLQPPVCSSQEAPLKNVTQFQKNISFRTDVCDRERRMFANEFELRDALAGLDLSAYVTTYKDTSEEFLFSLTDEGTIYPFKPGLIAVLMDEIADRGKFTWRKKFFVGPVLNEVDFELGRTWTELLLWSVDTFDISLDFWDMSNERREKGISYVNFFYDDSIILVSKSVKKVEFTGFLKPFSYPLWFLIGVSIFLTGFLYNFLERLHDNSDERRPDLLAAAFLSAITFTGHFEFKPNSHAARLLSLTWSFWALIVASAYTANMASVLLSPSKPSVGVSSLKDVVELNKTLCIWEGTNQHSYVNASFPTYSQSDKLKKQQGNDQIRNGIFTGECDVGLMGKTSFDLFERDEILNADCLLTRVGATLDYIPAGFVTKIDTGSKCTSLISYVLDLHMTEMKDDGFFERAWEQIYKTKGFNTCNAGNVPEEDMLSEPLHLNDMGGIFMLHGIACGLSVIIALLLKLWHRWVSGVSDEEGRTDTSSDLKPRNHKRLWRVDSNMLLRSRRVLNTFRRNIAANDAQKEKYNQRRSIWSPTLATSPEFLLDGSDKSPEDD